MLGKTPTLSHLVLWETNQKRDYNTVTPDNKNDFIHIGGIKLINHHKANSIRPD